MGNQLDCNFYASEYDDNIAHLDISNAEDGRDSLSGISEGDQGTFQEPGNAQSGLMEWAGEPRHEARTLFPATQADLPPGEEALFLKNVWHPSGFERCCFSAPASLDGSRVEQRHVSSTGPYSRNSGVVPGSAFSNPTPQVLFLDPPGPASAAPAVLWSAGRRSGAYAQELASAAISPSRTFTSSLSGSDSPNSPFTPSPDRRVLFHSPSGQTRSALHMAIVQLVRMNDEEVMLQKKGPLVKELLGLVKQACRVALQPLLRQRKIRVELFGSYAYDLVTSDSDVDIAIVGVEEPGKNGYSLEQQRRLLQYMLPLAKCMYDLGRGRLTIANPLLCSYPLLKATMDGFLQIDVTFNRRNIGDAVRFMRRCLTENPILGHLTLVLKGVLSSHGLMKVYLGGLPSYGLSVLVMAFLKMHPEETGPQHDLGKLLLGFFKLYSSLDVGQFGVTWEGVKPLTEIFPNGIPADECGFPNHLCIMEPMSNRNMCKNNVRFSEMQRLFALKEACLLDAQARGQGMTQLCDHLNMLVPAAMLQPEQGPGPAGRTEGGYIHRPRASSKPSGKEPSPEARPIPAPSNPHPPPHPPGMRIRPPQPPTTPYPANFPQPQPRPLEAQHGDRNSANAFGVSPYRNLPAPPFGALWPVLAPRPFRPPADPRIAPPWALGGMVMSMGDLVRMQQLPLGPPMGNPPPCGPRSNGSPPSGPPLGPAPPTSVTKALHTLSGKPRASAAAPAASIAAVAAALERILPPAGRGTCRGPILPAGAPRLGAPPTALVATVSTAAPEQPPPLLAGQRVMPPPKPHAGGPQGPVAATARPKKAAEELGPPFPASGSAKNPAMNLPLSAVASGRTKNAAAERALPSAAPGKTRNAAAEEHALSAAVFGKAKNATAERPLPPAVASGKARNASAKDLAPMAAASGRARNTPTERALPPAATGKAGTAAAEKHALMAAVSGRARNAAAEHALAPAATGKIRNVAAEEHEPSAAFCKARNQAEEQAPQPPVPGKSRSVAEDCAPPPGASGRARNQERGPVAASGKDRNMAGDCAPAAAASARARNATEEKRPAAAMRPRINRAEDAQPPAAVAGPLLKRSARAEHKQENSWGGVAGGPRGTFRKETHAPRKVWLERVESPLRDSSGSGECKLQ